MCYVCIPSKPLILLKIKYKELYIYIYIYIYTQNKYAYIHIYCLLGIKFYKLTVVNSGCELSCNRKSIHYIFNGKRYTGHTNFFQKSHLFAEKFYIHNVCFCEEL